MFPLKVFCGCTTPHNFSLGVYGTANMFSSKHLHVVQKCLQNLFQSMQSKPPVSDSGQLKLSSKTAGTIRIQNPNICTQEESSRSALSNDHRWSLRTRLLRKLSVVLFPIQISIELKTAGTKSRLVFGRHTIFRKEQQWDIVSCVSVARSTSHSCERAVSFKNACQSSGLAILPVFETPNNRGRSPQETQSFLFLHRRIPSLHCLYFRTGVSNRAAVLKVHAYKVRRPNQTAY